MTTATVAQATNLREQVEQWHADINDALEDIENFAALADLDAITMAIGSHAVRITEIVVETIRQRDKMPGTFDTLRKQCEVVQNQLEFQLRIVENRTRLELSE